MGETKEALFQIEGYLDYLKDEETGLMFHIFDAGTNCFVRKKLWATGNGWTLLGMARVIEIGKNNGENVIVEKLIKYATDLLDAMLKYQLADGRFHDILDEEDSFVEGTAAMMMATFIYRGVAGNWLSSKYLEKADLVRKTMEHYVNSYGVIQEVCGCPDFVEVGTSAESMASYLMMHAHYQRMDK